MRRKSSVFTITLVGLMAAMCFVATFLRIDIPTPLGKTMIHMGNVLCLLAGLLLGPLKGGLAAGIGSAFFDLFDPVFVVYAPFTFLFKFMMAFVCGVIAKKGTRPRRIAGAVAGSVTYVILYITQNIVEGLWFLKQPLATVLVVASTKLTVSLVNGLIAVAASLILYTVLAPILRRAGVLETPNAK